MKKLFTTVLGFFLVCTIFLTGPNIYAGGFSGSLINQKSQEVTFSEELNEILNPEMEEEPKKENNTQFSEGFWGIKDWKTILISTIAGGLLGFGTVILVEWLKEPNIVFEVGTEDDDPTNQRKFIHIKIRNLNKKFRYSPINTSIASSAKALIKIEDQQFIGRWTSKGEPLIYGPGNIPIAVNPNEILVTPREDICPAPLGDDNEVVQVAIGMKYENENEFYGFNNESYLYQPHLKNNKRQFGQGEFVGEILIYTLGNKYNKRFRVYNPTTNRNDFKLELVDNKF